MLQYILSQSTKYSVTELAQMAVEGGCQWITLSLDGCSDSEIREMIVPDVLDMCRESGVFLTIDDRPELATELGIHGVRLSAAYFASHPGASAASMREQLGPEAVIGIETVDPTALHAMVAADIDFAYIPYSTGDERLAKFIEAVKAAGTALPVVVSGNIRPDDIPGLLADGYSGVAVSLAITDAHDPVEATTHILDIIKAMQ